MKKIIKNKDLSTPEIYLDTNTNYLYIKGRCFPENIQEILKDVLNFISNKKIETVQIEMDYFNSSSSKMLYQIITDSKCNNIIWYCEKDDEDMLDDINYFKYILNNVDFKIKFVDKIEHLNIKDIEKLRKEKYNSFFKKINPEENDN